MSPKSNRRVLMTYADEKMKLAAEDGTKPARAGQVTIRALHNFIIYNKDTREAIAPLPDQGTKRFWSTCRVEGKVASLAGASKNLVQAGYWDVDWVDSHFVTMCLKGIVGLYRESDPYYRNGHPALFLYTKNYAYALLAPTEYYQPTWTAVLTAWNVPAFDWVDLQKPRPLWWTPLEGDWDHLQAIFSQSIQADAQPGDEERGAASSKPNAPQPGPESGADNLSEGEHDIDGTNQAPASTPDTAPAGIVTRSASRKLGKGAVNAAAGKGVRLRAKEKNDHGKGKQRAKGGETSKRRGAGEWDAQDEEGGNDGNDDTAGATGTVPAGVPEVSSPQMSANALMEPPEKSITVACPGEASSNDPRGEPPTKRVRIESPKEDGSPSRSPPGIEPLPLAPTPVPTPDRKLLAEAAERRIRQLQTSSAGPAPPGPSTTVVTPPRRPSPSLSSLVSSSPRRPVLHPGTPQALQAPFTQVFPGGPPDTTSMDVDMSVSEDESSDTGVGAMEAYLDPAALHSSPPACSSTEMPQADPARPLPTAPPGPLRSPPPPPTPPLASSSRHPPSTPPAQPKDVAGVPGWKAATLNIYGFSSVATEGPANTPADDPVPAPEGPRNPPTTAKRYNTRFSKVQSHSGRLIADEIDELELTPDDM